LNPILILAGPSHMMQFMMNFQIKEEYMMKVDSLLLNQLCKDIMELYLLMGKQDAEKLIP